MTKDLDKGYSWVVLLLCSLIYMLSSASFKNFGILYGQLQQYYNSGSGNTASIGSLAGFLQSVTSSLANTLCVRYSFRTILFIGGLLISLSYLMSGFMPDFNLLYLTYSVIGGFGLGFSLVPSATIINFYFEKRRNLANGVVASSSGFGSLFLPYFYRYVFDRYIHEGAFLLLSGFFLHICVAASLIRQPVILKCKRKQETEKKTRFWYPKRKGLVSSPDSVLSSLRQFFAEAFNFDWALLKLVPYVLHVIALSLCFLGYTANYYMIPSYIEAIGYDKQNTAFVLSLMGLCEIATRIISGWFLDLKIVSAKTFFVFNVMLGSLAAEILPFIPTFEYVCVYGAIISCFPGTLYSILPTLLLDEIGLKRLPKAIGLVFLFGAVMYTTGIPILGWLKDKTGTWNLSFHILGGVFFLSAITMIVQMLYTKKKHKTSEKSEEKCEQETEDKHNNSIQINSRYETDITEDQPDITEDQPDISEDQPMF